MKKLIILFAAMALLLAGCDNVDVSVGVVGGADDSNLEIRISPKNDNENTGDVNDSNVPIHTGQQAATEGNLSVHYIDVGQADCILLIQGTHSMLIDGGNNDDGKAVVSYLQKQGITRLDYVIGTHPHEDHIGGLDNVIKAFEIGQVIMPKVSHNTTTYEDVLKAVKNKGLSITAAKAGQSYTLGQAQMHILSPTKNKYDDLNAYSVVTRVVFGENSFLFTGDMITENETALLKAKANVSADVLKVAHHGSYTSNSKEFLSAVGAKYAVIQVGKGNDYGHPHTNILQRISALSTVYRTDRNGTIVVTSNGKDINVQTERQAE